MDTLGYEARIAALEKENRILKQKLVRSEANRAMIEEALETHSYALKVRNAELEESQELIRQSEARYRILALHDTLTGLSNRIMFQEQLARAIDHSKRNYTYTAIFFIDLDGFKPVNDNWGHEVGDKVLREIAVRLRSCVRVKDAVARIGGDEFAILLTDLRELQDVGTFAERVLGIIAKPIPLGEQFCIVGASIGISYYPLDGSDMNLLLQNADAAMYSIKKTGRNGYRFYRDLQKADLPKGTTGYDS
jgi:diguanylate cyclase (GGDEF)-like protein